MKRNVRAWVAAGALIAAVGFSYADPGTLTVSVDKPGAKISPTFYGLMTEEINYSYDGGLYGELIRNRIFQDVAGSGRGGRGRPGNPPAGPEAGAAAPVSPNLVHWSVYKTGQCAGAIDIDKKDPVNAGALANSLKLEITDVNAGESVGVSNDGYWGIPVKADAEYKASFYAKADALSGLLTVTLLDADGKTAATGTVANVGAEWKKYEVTLKTGALKPSAGRFVISASSKGTLWLSLVSLFPPTYHDRPNGFRPDIMEKLADMQPAFLRFPGGNYVEGNDWNNYFNWKTTVGRYEDRPGHRSPWNYRSTDGMGLLEFLYWCEDLKMEPVLAVFAGHILQGGAANAAVTGDALKPYVQDAVDEIEYVTGDPSTEWGAKRAKDGHPAPFKLTYVEIGNEDNLSNGGATYNARFTAFYDAIKAKYPKLQIISTLPPGRAGFGLTRRPDVIDDHLYAAPVAMQQASHRFDTYNRNNPKIFMGEWAAQEGTPTPTFNSALGDAAFLTGLERNADVVVMECYAPLFVNVNQGGRQWNTNLIGYDALSSFGSPSYYMQQMFASNRGDRVLPVTVAAQPPASAAVQAMPTGGVGVGTWGTSCEFKDLKVVSGDKTLFESDLAKGTDGFKLGNGRWAAADGVLRQANANGDDFRATAGDVGWGDYTYTLKARKLAGAEGFLIMFHVKDQDNFTWWNVGGWGNTRSALEMSANGGRTDLGQSVDMQVEANRWYDVRIEVKGRDIQCFLDDKLITQAAVPVPSAAGGVFASASLVDASGDVIVKVVNTLATPQQLQLNLEGAKEVAKDAVLDVLTGQLVDVNSIAEPMKVAPKREAISDADTKFVHEFPAHSISVLRLKTK